MAWALLILGTLVTLSVIGFAFYTTKDTRNLHKRLRVAEKLTINLERDLRLEKSRRFSETLTLQQMLGKREKIITMLEGHVEELEKLLADAGGDELTLRRLRHELSEAYDAIDSEDDEWLPD